MEIIRTLKVPRQFIFDKLLESGLYDIEKILESILKSLV